MKILSALKLRWSERERLIAAGGVCGLMLIVAALLPLSVSTGEAPAAEQSGAARIEESAALFVSYWYHDAAGITVEHPETLESKTAAFCNARSEELIARCIDDTALTDRTPTGSDYIELRGENSVLRLYRVWLQAKGDWQNWLDVCFDADSGAVYYLYLSRECLSNFSQYRNAPRHTMPEIAALLAEDRGGTVRYIVPGEGENDGTAALALDGGTVFYALRDAVYDTLIDVRVNCVA